jgi:hypothetical protein
MADQTPSGTRWRTETFNDGQQWRSHGIFDGELGFLWPGGPGRMPFLTPNQECYSKLQWNKVTKGIQEEKQLLVQTIVLFFLFK